jgi:DNA processing protein
MTPVELEAWLRLTLTPGVGNITARKLLVAFGLPEAIFCQSVSALGQVLDSQQVQQVRTEPPGLAKLLQTTLSWLAQSGSGAQQRRVVTLGDCGYPSALQSLDDPPLMLYLLGAGEFTDKTPLAPAEHASTAPYLEATPYPISPANCLAVVGSRNPTPQGLIHAREFCKTLGQAGLTIVSGLALGIDGAAHEGALSAPASTVAVVGTGLDRVYPKAHHALAHRIAQTGLLVSEYPLGTPPLTANFPKRNRLIAGLAQGTLVVEAALKSGSLITARLSAEQGKDVFAIPGSIHAAQARGCHALIKQGAKLIESAQDVLEEFALPGAFNNAINSVAVDACRTSAKGLFDEQNLLLDSLGFDPMGLDALQARTGLDAAQLQVQLLNLELDALVARLPGGLFQRLS